MRPRPVERYFTANSAMELSKILDVRYDKSMQDWPYEVADPKSIEKYLEHYQLIENENLMFTLMMIIIQSIEEQESVEKLEFYWERAKRFLERDFELHASTIYYWSLIDEDSVDGWRISPYMSLLWKSQNAQL